MDQGAMRIKMQRGSRCNEDQDAMSIKMQAQKNHLFIFHKMVLFSQSDIKYN